MMRFSGKITAVLALCLVFCCFFSALPAAAEGQPTLSETSIKLAVRDYRRLEVTGADQEVVWESANPKVASVTAAGLVRGVRAGTTEILAKIGDVSLSCRVKVENPSLSATKLTLVKGTESTLKLKKNTQEITWSSSAPKVAEVSSKGVVRAMAKGSARITAKVGNRKFTCRVTVEDPVLNKTRISLKPGGKEQLRLTGTKQKVKWKSASKRVAKVAQNGLVTAVGPGDTVITATVGKAAIQCRVTVSSYIALDKDTLELEEGGSSGRITVTCLSSKAKNTIAFRADVGGVVDCDFGDWNGLSLPLYVRPIGAGTAVITITHDSTGEEHSVTVTVKSAVTVETPDLPQTVNQYTKAGKLVSTCEITEASCTARKRTGGGYIYTITIGGTKTYDVEGAESDAPCEIGYKLYLKNKVVKSGRITTYALEEGESFSDVTTSGTVSKPGEYRLVFYSIKGN